MHDKLDVLDGEVDEHTSDLGGLGSDDLGDVLVENGTDLVLVVGVLGDDSLDDLVAGHQVALLDAHLRHLLLLLLLLHHLLLLDLLLSNRVGWGCLHVHLVHAGWAVVVLHATII